MSAKFIKIGYDLAELLTKVCCHVFYVSQCNLWNNGRLKLYASRHIPGQCQYTAYVRNADATFSVTSQQTPETNQVSETIQQTNAHREKCDHCTAEKPTQTLNDNNQNKRSLSELTLCFAHVEGHKIHQPLKLSIGASSCRSYLHFVG